MLPNDPIILLGVVNAKLRDEYDNLGELCASLGEDRDDLVNRLSSIGYVYDPGQNQFR